jgi:DnaJ-class molecular chaperone
MSYCKHCDTVFIIDRYCPQCGNPPEVVTSKRWVACASCDMTGEIPLHPENLDCEMTTPCPSCQGRGEVQVEVTE